ncbi:MAG TPA: hypothetical protein VG164_01335 [Trebonia sp.]|jgi:hypothetical protein|nr:hypothetical protein [Trebonia sp.]
MNAAAEEPYERTSGPVHTWFGLTYANFLVIHRARLQSMPLDWQGRFTGLLDDLHAAYPDLGIPCFEVTTVKDTYVGDLTEQEMQQLGITRGDDSDSDDADPVYYDRTGRELSVHDHVGIPVPDPVPHYKHAYLPPDEAAITEARRAGEELPARRIGR